MSHLAFVKEADAAVETRLLRLLGREAAWLYEQRYRRALHWLGRWYEPSSALHRALEGHRLFWAWWVNDWQHRDHDLSQRLTVDGHGRATYTANGAGTQLFFQEREALEDFYLRLHDPNQTRISVPPVVLDEVKRELRQKQNNPL